MEYNSVILTDNVVVYSMCALGGIAFSFVFIGGTYYCYKTNFLGVGVQENLSLLRRFTTAPIARMFLADSTSTPLPISVSPLPREPMILLSPDHDERVRVLNETRWNSFTERFYEMRNATREGSDGPFSVSISSESSNEIGVSILQLQEPLRICANTIIEGYSFDPLIVTTVLNFPMSYAFTWIRLFCILWGVIRWGVIRWRFNRCFLYFRKVMRGLFIYCNWFLVLSKHARQWGQYVLYCSSYLYFPLNKGVNHHCIRGVKDS